MDIRDPRVRKQLVNHNIWACKFGLYVDKPMRRMHKLYYDADFQLAPPFEYANVYVDHLHPIDVVYKYMLNGITSIPLIVNTVTTKFTGSESDIYNCSGLHDPLINARTSFGKNILANGGSNMFPINPLEAVYVPDVYVIRNEYYNTLDKNNAYRVSLVNVLLEDMEMNFDNFIRLYETIQLIFQVAITGNYETLILNDIGIKTCKYPINDVILMINNCIHKYGHMIKTICVSLHVTCQSDKGCLAQIEKNIKYPQYYIQEYLRKEQEIRSELESSMQGELLTNNNPINNNIVNNNPMNNNPMNNNPMNNNIMNNNPMNNVMNNNPMNNNPMNNNPMNNNPMNNVMNNNPMNNNPINNVMNNNPMNNNSMNNNPMNNNPMNNVMNNNLMNNNLMNNVPMNNVPMNNVVNNMTNLPSYGQRS